MYNNFLRNSFLILFIAIFLMPCTKLFADGNKIHPKNIQLMKAGILKGPPKFFPEIPRLTPREALYLYESGKALFVLISYQNKDLILGGLHLTEDMYPKINPNRLPFKKDQVLVCYCP